jgi:Ca2+-binding RTX toxin-like protein
LVYIPTDNPLDELTTTLNFTVSDSFGGTSDFSVTVTEYAEDPLESISEIIAPVNYGKSGTGTLVLSDGLSEVFGSSPATGQVTLYTDFGPKNGSEPSNVSYVDDELSVFIIVDGITFQVASGSVSEDWTYDPTTGFKVSTVSFSDIIGTVGGSQITLEDYLESYPPSPGDEWQVIADDGVPGNNQARFVEVQVSTTESGNGAPSAIVGDASQPNVIYGTSGSDQIFGGLDDDVIVGQDGDDVLAGGTGTDSLTGGSGSDVFLLAIDGEADTIEDYVLDDDIIDLTQLFDVATDGNAGDTLSDFVSYDAGILTIDVDGSKEGEAVDVAIVTTNGTDLAPQINILYTDNGETNQVAA